MNKTRIEYADYTWNPVTGCLHGCSYCYARRQAERGMGSYGLLEQGRRFAPTIWYDRLDEPKRVRKPSRIFVSSMGDLFGSWVPPDWIGAVLDMAHECPQHTFLLLTKNPRCYAEFDLPDNCWAGTSCEDMNAAAERIPALLEAKAAVRWVSLEPLLGWADIEPYLWLMGPSTAGPWTDALGRRRGGGGIGGQMISRIPSGDIHWVVVGAQTGRRAVKPDEAWVRDIAQQCREARTPLFCKANLGFPDLPQEHPQGVELQTGLIPHEGHAREG